MKVNEEFVSNDVDEGIGGVAIIDPWDVVGTFDGNDLVLNIRMDEDGYEIMTLAYLRTKSDFLDMTDRVLLPDEFKDTTAHSVFVEQDYIIYVQLEKIQGSVNRAGDKQIKTHLKKVTSGGKPYFIALHVKDKENKYRRKSETSVTDKKGRYLLNIALV